MTITYLLYRSVLLLAEVDVQRVHLSELFSVQLRKVGRLLGHEPGDPGGRGGGGGCGGL